MMKKTVLVVVMFLVSTNLWAASDVSKTWHNMSSTSPEWPYQSTNEDEVCIYCHTPHGGTLDAPLWNRALPTGAFTHYSSATLSATIVGVNRAVNAESLVCMSCHDGAVALNAILNESNSTGGPPSQSYPLPPPPSPFGVGSVIGTIAINGAAQAQSRNLTDDHPISFSYHDVYNDVAEDYTLQLRAYNLAEAAGVRFFPLNTGAAGDVAGGKRVECSSCHDPHVNYVAARGGDASLAPFLVRSNAASALCLACHIK